MLVKAQHDTVTKDFLNLTLLMVVAFLLSVLIGRVTAGAHPLRNDVPSSTLPPMEEYAKPMPPMAPMTKMPREAVPPAREDFDLIANLWTVLELHRNGDMEEALAGWESLGLPCHTEVWRDVGLTAAHLRVGNVEQAADVLDYALRKEPKNAVLHYYNALALLTKAADAPDWFDATPAPSTRFVSHTLGRVTRARALYHLAAINEFETAIELAKQVTLGQQLVTPVLFVGVPMVEPIGNGVKRLEFASLPNGESYEPLYSEHMPLAPPTVADLLEVLGAENFEGKAHNMLAPLYLKRGLLPQAEEHMDAAAALNMNVLDGYQQLADRYEAREQHGDAFRANLKAIGRAGGIVGPARKALDALRNSFNESR